MDVLRQIDGYNAERKRRYDTERAAYLERKAAEQRWEAAWAAVGRECGATSCDSSHVPDSQPFFELVSVLRDRDMVGWLPDMLVKWQKRQSTLCWKEEGLVLALLKSAADGDAAEVVSERLTSCRTWPFGCELLAEGADNIRHFFLARMETRERETREPIAGPSGNAATPVDAPTPESERSAGNAGSGNESGDGAHPEKVITTSERATQPLTSAVDAPLEEDRSQATPRLEPSDELMKTYRDPDNYWRNVWLYKQREAGASNADSLRSLKQIAADNEFAPLESENALRTAIETITLHHKWPVVRGRPGRPRMRPPTNRTSSK